MIIIENDNNFFPSYRVRKKTSNMCIKEPFFFSKILPHTNLNKGQNKSKENRQKKRRKMVTLCYISREKEKGVLFFNDRDSIQ